MGTIASQITSLTVVYSSVYSGADQRKHQNRRFTLIWQLHTNIAYKAISILFPPMITGFAVIIFFPSGDYELWHIAGYIVREQLVCLAFLCDSTTRQKLLFVLVKRFITNISYAVYNNIYSVIPWTTKLSLGPTCTARWFAKAPYQRDNESNGDDGLHDS